MVTFEQLVELAAADIEASAGTRHVIDRDVIEHVVRSTLKGIDFHVNDKGERSATRVRSPSSTTRTTVIDRLRLALTGISPTDQERRIVAAIAKCRTEW